MAEMFWEADIISLSPSGERAGERGLRVALSATESRTSPLPVRLCLTTLSPSGEREVMAAMLPGAEGQLLEPTAAKRPYIHRKPQRRVTPTLLTFEQSAIRLS